METNKELEAAESKLNEPANKQIKDDAWGIIEIFLSARENFEIAKKLYKPNNEFENAYLNSSDHLKFIRQSLWRHCLIDVAKLINEGKSDDYKLSKLINKLKKDGIYRHHQIDKSKIKAWENMLLVKHQAITNISLLRDSSLVHLDKDRKDKLKGITVSFEDVEYILNMAKDIVTHIYHIVLESGLDLASPFSSRPCTILSELTENRERKLAQMVENLKKS